MATFDVAWAVLEAWRALLVLLAVAQIGVLFAALARADAALRTPGAVLLRELGLWPLVPSLAIGAAPVAAWLAWSPGDVQEWLTSWAILGTALGLTALGLRALLRTLVLRPDGVVPAAPWRPAMRWAEVAFVKEGYYLLPARGLPLRIDRRVSWIGRFAVAALQNLPPRVFAGDEPSERDLRQDARLG
jgi:hypothetical protein